MDGGIPQKFGYLGEIHLFIPDHLLCGLNLQERIIFDDPTAAFFMDELLQAGTPHKIVSTDLFNRQMSRQMDRQIPADPCKSFLISIFL